MSEALPLADQPHLLQPHSKREDLFGIPRQPTANAGPNQNPLEGLPTRLSLSARGADNQNTPTPTFSQIIQRSAFASSDTRRNSVTIGDSSAKHMVIFHLHNI